MNNKSHSSSQGILGLDWLPEALQGGILGHRPQAPFPDRQHTKTWQFEHHRQLQQRARTNHRSTNNRKDCTTTTTNNIGLFLSTFGGGLTKTLSSSQPMNSKYDASASSLLGKLLQLLFLKPVIWALHLAQVAYTLGTLSRYTTYQDICPLKTHKSKYKMLIR